LKAGYGKIQILPEEVINKIAAGEIVERPASVVKELVENSIDAGATRITVEIKKGGRDLIKVTDNGKGMTREDALLSLERHSTSKIRTAEEIENIDTLGFRGEALPSIAAVSRMELTTRATEAEAGVRIRLEGNKVKTVRETGCPAGTSVSVEQLFFNTPARRKFLKTIPTEMGHIINTLSQEALTRRETSFELTHNGKLLLKAPAGTDLLERILYLYGNDMRDSLIPFDGKNDWIEARGFLAKPEYARSGTQLMVTFVNKRPVRSKILSHAILAGYRPLLPRDRFPAIFLFIEIKPELIDVNIHPQKSEVKFQETNAVHDFVSQLMGDSLGKGETVPKFPSGTPAGKEREKGIREAVEKYMGRGKQLTREREAKEGGTARYEQTTLSEMPVTGEAAAEREKISDYVPMAQLHNTYIVAETRESIVLIDQHAAHERILYEQLGEEFKKTRIASQRLLIPFSIELSRAGAALISEKTDVFNSAGFDVEHFGENSFTLRAIPASLNRAEPRRLFLEVVDDLLTLGKIKEQSEFMDKMITVMACRGAIKAGDKLQEDEMRGLIRNLSKTQSPYFCPHGRPTVIRLTLIELEKRFKRRS
jgi:DNA mismatch repair protein MutL